MAGTMVGCSLERKQKDTTKDSDIEVVLNMDDLEDGGYYIQREDSYEKLYVQDANYEIAKVNTTTSDASRTLWYREDWSKVPTMYKGDKLIFKTTATLDEECMMERFEYVGYTVGVTGLTETPSGRYSYSTDGEDMNINTSAKDAQELLKLSTDTATIDKIGGAYLRSGNISRGGCILGLEKDKTYVAEVYAGTIMHQFKLKANNMALTSMEMYESVDFDYMQSQIISINFPDYFNSGYYLINNFGLVRYVNGTSYDDTTDFNIPNVAPDEEEESSTSETSESSDADEDVKTEIVEIKAPAEYTVKVEYTESPNMDLQTPSAELIGSKEAYRLEVDKDEYTLSKTTLLEPGEYKLKIYDLAGRQYTYEVKATAQTFVADSSSTQD